MPDNPALPLDPTDFSPRFAAAALAAGFTEEKLGEINGHPLLAYTKKSGDTQPKVYFSTGIHGDEPAPPWALLRLIQEGFFDDRCSWFLCPLLNPTGFSLRTRENFSKVDLNRDYKAALTAESQAHIAWLKRQPRFDLVVCGHEDWEATGFYLYELNLANRATLAHAMLDAARAHGPIDLSAVIDGRESAEPGIIRPTTDPALRETWPEALYLAYQHCALVYTIETASGQPLEQRVTTQAAVLRAVVAGFLA